MISTGSIPDWAERVLIGISWRVSVSIWNEIEKKAQYQQQQEVVARGGRGAEKQIKTGAN